MSNTIASEQRRMTVVRVTDAIAAASQRTGVDFDLLLNQARIESGLNPDARARTSSATGLFQFTRQTWLATLKQHGADHGLGWAAESITRAPDGRYHVADPETRSTILNLRLEPEAASAMAGEFASENSQYLERKLGRSPEGVDIYLAHFLGAAGAVRFLKAMEENPDAAAADIMPKAAAANRTIFYTRDGNFRSLAEVRQRFASKLEGAGGAVQYAAPAAHESTQLTVAVAERPAASAKTGPEHPQMLGFVEMPRQLSLAFARQAYLKLASLDSSGLS
jgi:Transglycosylase SLT domain